MNIPRIFAHRVELPLHEGSYKWSGGKSVAVFDSTIVGVETDTGLIGYGDITTAAIAHLAHSTPEEFRFTSTDFNSYVTVSTAEGAPQREHGFMSASTTPGLGITPRMDVLGKRVVDIS